LKNKYSGHSDKYIREDVMNTLDLDLCFMNTKADIEIVAQDG
jgi:hypothetical protein